MWMLEQEYSLADLFEQPALSLAIERGGFDARSLALLLRVESGADRRCRPFSQVRTADDYIAE